MSGVPSVLGARSPCAELETGILPAQNCGTQVSETSHSVPRRRNRATMFGSINLAQQISEGLGKCAPGRTHSLPRAEQGVRQASKGAPNEGTRVRRRLKLQTRSEQYNSVTWSRRR